MNCRFVATDKPRMLTSRHVEDCPEWHPPLVWCRGCQPCPRNHCQDCGIEHVDQLTCPECIGAVREHLTEILRMVDLVPAEATRKGVQSEAFHLSGPTANPDAYRQRRRYGYRDHIETRRDGTTFRADVMGEEHPLWVLGTWDLLITEHLGHTRSRRDLVTVPDAAAYLGRNLSELAQDEDFPWVDLAADVRRCESHLERVLHDGEQVETGAPCLKCSRPVVRETDSKGRERVHCERCKRDLTANEYRNTVKAQYVEHADRLNVSDLSTRIGVPESTLRRWASVKRNQRKGEEAVEHPPLIRSCGTDSGGRKVYRVTDAERVRDEGGDTRGRKRAVMDMSGTVSNERGDKSVLNQTA